MTENKLNVVIKLRRDYEYNFNLVGDTLIPADGEVILVDSTNGLRIKIGNGVTPYNSLDFLDNNNNVVLRGYLLNENFYTDTTYNRLLEKSENKIYINNNDNGFYSYKNGKFTNINDTILTATSKQAGIMKLYGTNGENVDGTMTQKSITDGVKSIHLNLSTNDSECLELSLPW